MPSSRGAREERGNEITLVMPFKESLIGNVMLPALHGGTIGALLGLRR